MECALLQDQSRLDGEEFRCVSPLCRRRFSIRTGTVWNNFRRIPLVLVRLVLYYYTEEISASRAARILNRAGLQLTGRSVRRVYGDIRRMMLYSLQRTVLTGLLRGVIEIDEALFTHRSAQGEEAYDRYTLQVRLKAFGDS